MSQRLCRVLAVNGWKGGPTPDRGKTGSGHLPCDRSQIGGTTTEPLSRG